MKAMKIKLYPTLKQLNLIKVNINNARYVYNHCLALNNELYEKSKSKMSNYDMNNYITNLKKQKGYEWLNESGSQVLQAAIKRLDVAYQNFFRRLKTGDTPGFPKFKTKYDNKKSITYPQYVKFNNKHNKIFIPKIGYIKIKGYRHDLVGDLKMTIITLHKDNLCTASIIIDNKNQVSINTNNIAIGLDVGVKKLITDSNGNKILPLDINKYIKQIKNLQIVLSRLKKSSANFNKLKHKLQKRYRKLSNVRLNYIHHVVNNYINYKVVFVEELNIKKMTVNTIGTLDNPNYDSTQKTNLNNKIIQQSWGMLFNILEYKLNDKNSMLFKVNPKFTSQICSKCGNIDKKSRNKEHYNCVMCGHTIDADHNAAINILNRGLTHIPDLKSA